MPRVRQFIDPEWPDIALQWPLAAGRDPPGLVRMTDWLVRLSERLPAEASVLELPESNSSKKHFLFALLHCCHFLKLASECNKSERGVRCMLLQSQNTGKYAVRKYKTYFFLPPQNGKWYCLTHVILPVDYGVVVCWAAGVSLHGFYVISAVGCVDGSLKLTLQHRAVAGRSVFTCGKRPCGQYDVKKCKR